MSERRYTEDEAREIFDRASRVDSAGVGPSRESSAGLTLRELQEIGAEVGLAADAVARAASSLTEVRGSRRVSWLGLPVGVSQSVALGRAMTDAEWAWLVMRLRETFQARGQTSEEGLLREWWNGNLRIAVEPTAEGDVLHMSTLKGGVREGMWMGLSLIGFAAVMAVIIALKGDAETFKMALPFIFGGAGVGTLISNSLRLPPWFRTRKAQFEALGRAVLSRGSRERELASPEDDAGSRGDDGLLPSSGAS